jgi:integrase
MLNAAPLYMRCFILLCSDLAIRSGTAAKIAPRHFDAETGTLTFRTKFDGGMSLPVTEELRRILDAVGDRDVGTPYVAQLHKNNHLSQVQLQANFQKLRREVGIKKRIVPHDLRRSTAVRALEQTGDLRIVQAILGHRRLENTLHYLDHRNTTVTKETLAAVAAGEKR